MNRHEIITMVDGSEWDLVFDSYGRFMALIPQDEGKGLNFWYPPTNLID